MTIPIRLPGSPRPTAPFLALALLLPHVTGCIGVRQEVSGPPVAEAPDAADVGEDAAATTTYDTDGAAENPAATPVAPEASPPRAPTADVLVTATAAARGAGGQ